MTVSRPVLLVLALAATAGGARCRDARSADERTTPAAPPQADGGRAPDATRAGVVTSEPDEVERCRREELARMRDGVDTRVAPPAQPLRLRSEPRDLPEDACEQAARRWNFYTQANEGGCFVNAFGDVTADTVVDRATRLMWQRGTSPEVTLPLALKYVAKLNAERFGGYSDWRLPTIEELLSLVEYGQNRTSPHAHLDGTIFAAGNDWWSADSFSPENAQWGVDALLGHCGPAKKTWEKRVRAVRSVATAGEGPTAR